MSSCHQDFVAKVNIVQTAEFLALLAQLRGYVRRRFPFCIFAVKSVL
jgi:hypothetical protein